MAYKNKIITNPKTGQAIKFLQTAKDTDGRLLEMETTYNSRSKEPPAHYHPFQAEHFTIVSGQLTVQIDGNIKLFNEGDSLHIPANKVHSMWNASDDKAVVNWKVEPAMNTENLLETLIGLAMDGTTDDDGRPNLLQVALIADKYSNVFRLAKPAFPVQKILFLILTPFSYLAGYWPTYKKYLD